MLETISAIICVLFIIIGLVEVFRSIVLFVLRPKGEDTAMTIVPICGHNEEAEYLLRSAAARVKWADNGRERRVICFDGMGNQLGIIDAPFAVDGVNGISFETDASA